mmetsp:Transcript_27074/g.39615  ORF Transcript_27074/g.39615 Transcript_27074/m.39615 type:complete len:166 (+) Transcript_27074:125-622(+)
MATTTPLLRLLDSWMSRNDRQVQEVYTEIQTCIPHLRLVHPSPTSVLQTLLDHSPSLATIASEQDGSLPLHFAASLGNVAVASMIYSKVREGSSLGSQPRILFDRCGGDTRASYTLEQQSAKFSLPMLCPKLQLIIAGPGCSPLHILILDTHECDGLAGPIICGV